MLMKNMPYLLSGHYLTIALREVSFPITKSELIQKVGEKDIPVSETKRVKLKEQIEKIPFDTFSCAAEFYCAYNACV